MAAEINLDGGEIAVLKAMGRGGSDVSGEDLLERCPGMEAAELIDILKGMVMLGYVEADKRSLYNEEEFKQVHFGINSGYSRAIREALDPTPQQKKSRRVRRE